MARPVFIVDGSRTPFLKARSGPGAFTPVGNGDVRARIASGGHLLPLLIPADAPPRFCGHTGTLLGVVLLSAIGPALTFLGVTAYWERALHGLIILAALAADALRARPALRKAVAGAAS